ncbi:cell wall-active antibiotics response protein [Simiduia sp. 21SJ11W-1]|uniref:cell wall-active antibiotics response protein n=1 Tax=Simiduia sp. 21SJ11W-1 TaxID=2909669 RepID=UPI0020A0FD8D|nr:cell wall-active antibiotics response protein [Simiduia sp. 21SJ11W-1]UTA46950.1 cell wall-active antibiotics response protein [Simiduia sp. 21SJ11W-1]
MSKHNGNLSPRTLFGLGLVAFAVLLFLNNIGIPFLGIALSNWPILMIIAGAIMLYNRKHVSVEGRMKAYLPHALIGFGILFQLSRMHILNFSVGAIIIPLVLLVVGINLLRPNRERHKTQADAQGNIIDGEAIADADFDDEGQQQSNPNDTTIDVFTILGGGNFSTRSKKLSGGSIIAILGGAEVDIREADAQKQTIELDVLAFMGGAEIKVPAHFNVTVKVLPLLGGVTNKTTCLADKMGVPQKHLVITGVALLGGLEITN